ncbi:sigma factor-like helix-turn-helix DNA-binding protein [Mycoplasma phocoeninasale]|uniref:Sigma-70 family RNA polymerase sigma factor n=1 Tax=Mycoplasma phocoeninasale TaxID=2726117 RepID=A0A858U2V7_9MOLU|nr:sigma factor-like helix-turn-helix DNA-binding protein [Mycoplasma phocoeninasale]MBN0970498.1 hypothetical protein [Mycoplasma phocoeninasale]QJG66379.1 hypothetical protein HGG64_01480 [Mycoplasma phocoeninasale]
MENISERTKVVELFEKYKDLLTNSQKQALYLHYFEDLSFSEIAQELAMTRSGAYDAVNKAKQKLFSIDSKIAK